MWFAAAVLFAVLAAGIIIYRAAKDDIIRTASNDTLTAPASSSRWRGDQITELFATVHESAVGPSPTQCDVRDLVVIRGKADVTRRRVLVANDPKRTYTTTILLRQL